MSHPIQGFWFFDDQAFAIRGILIDNNITLRPGDNVIPMSRFQNTLKLHPLPTNVVEKTVVHIQEINGVIQLHTNTQESVRWFTELSRTPMNEILIIDANHGKMLSQIIGSPPQWGKLFPYFDYAPLKYIANAQILQRPDGSLVVFGLNNPYSLKAWIYMVINIFKPLPDQRRISVHGQVVINTDCQYPPKFSVVGGNLISQPGQFPLQIHVTFPRVLATTPSIYLPVGTATNITTRGFIMTIPIVYSCRSTIEWMAHH